MKGAFHGVFDPTIFDNLKVVLEGGLYDLDSQGACRVTAREDWIDLAKFERLFRMRIALSESESCSAQIMLSSGLTDFAGELRKLRLAGDEPGARLQLVFAVPIGCIAHSSDIHTYVTGLWGEEAEVRHERTIAVNPHGAHADAAEGERDGQYTVSVRFRSKINESHLAQIEDWLEDVVSGLRFIESKVPADDTQDENGRG